MLVFNRFPHSNAARDGAVTVEMAMTLPVLFLVVLAGVEFGRMNMIRHTIDNAAYEAARKAIVPGATAADADREARRIMAVVGARGVQVAVTPANILPGTRQVNVRVSVNADQNGWLGNRFFTSRQIVGEVTMGREHL